jgi:putative addiction module component (TIGR02574 family)
MSNIEIIQEALQLTAKERYIIIESLLQSLDKPDKYIDDVWADEAQKRVKNYQENKAETISFDEVFK